MGGVGNKLPPGLLRLPENIRHAVEFLSQLRNFIAAPGLNVVGVIARLHHPHRLCQFLDSPGQCRGKYHADPQAEQCKHRRHQRQPVLNAPNHFRLLRIVLGEIHAADDPAGNHHRCSRPAGKALFRVIRAEHHFPVERLLQFRVHPGHVGTHHFPPGIVYHVFPLIGNQNVIQPRYIQNFQHRSHIFPCQRIQSRQRRGNHGSRGGHGPLFIPEHHISGGNHRVNVQNQQKQQHNGAVNRRQLKLHGAPRRPHPLHQLPLFLCPLCFFLLSPQNNSPLPIL